MIINDRYLLVQVKMISRSGMTFLPWGIEIWEQVLHTFSWQKDSDCIQ